jgi:hypothetical protein
VHSAHIQGYCGQLGDLIRYHSHARAVAQGRKRGQGWPSRGGPGGEGQQRWARRARLADVGQEGQAGRGGQGGAGLQKWDRRGRPAEVGQEGQACRGGTGGEGLQRWT